MKDKFFKACYFLHITDGYGQLDITDLSFMLMVGKVMLAPGIDWAAICTLIPLIMQQMHSEHLAANLKQ